MIWPYTSLIIIRVVRFYFVGTMLHSGWFLKTFLRRLCSKKKKKSLIVAVRRPILSIPSHCREHHGNTVSARHSLAVRADTLLCSVNCCCHSSSTTGYTSNSGHGQHFPLLEAACVNWLIGSKAFFFFSSPPKPLSSLC